MEKDNLLQNYKQLEHDLVKHKLTGKALGLALWDMDIASSDATNMQNAVEWSQELREMLGFADENDFPNTLGSLTSRIHPDDRVNANNSFISLINDHSDSTFFDTEYRLMHKDGTYVHYHAFGAAMRNSDGVPTRVAGALRCIEDRVAIQKIADEREKELLLKLREQEINERVQVIFDAAPMNVCIHEADGALIDVNHSGVKMFGFASKQDFIDENNRNTPMLSPKYQPCGTLSSVKAAAFFKKALDEGEAYFEWMHHTINGEDLPAEVNIVRINIYERIELVAFVRDMRDIKASQKREQEAISHQRQIYESNPIPSCLWNMEHEPIDCNDAMVALLGLSSRKDFSTKFMDFIPSIQPGGLSTIDTVAEVFSNTIEKGFHRFPWMLLGTNGEEIIGEATCVLIDLPDKQYLSVHFVDMREINAAMAKARRIEIVEESNRAKSRFLARMSHEIRTPISAVMGISEIQLQDQNLPPLIEESFAKIYNSSNTLLGIINAILDLSKIEAGKMDLLHEEYSTASMISDVAHTTPYIGNKNVTFDLHIDKRIPAMLIGDVVRIKQIMTNVLANAFKYTECGAINLAICCEAHAGSDTTTLLIAVSDTGMGMSPEQLEALAVDYTRFHEQANPNTSGTGLGMSIVYSLVKLMSADINIKSKINIGTEVIIRIPQKIASPEILGDETVQSLQKFEVKTHSPSGRYNFNPEPMPYGSVLIVDDIDANLYVAKGLLAFYSLNIETCTSGYETIDKIKRGNEYDIIFLDHTMPGIDGTQTLQILRSLGYKKPIIALTANALIGQAQEFINDGFDGFVSKPIQTAHLNTILTKFVRDVHVDKLNDAANAQQGDLHASTASSPSSIHNFQHEHKLLAKLQADFLTFHSTMGDDIRKAYDAKDIKAIYHLSHSLKGLAGLLHEPQLITTAAEVEATAKGEQLPSNAAITLLEAEFVHTIAKLKKLTTEHTPCTVPSPVEEHKLDKEALHIILDELEPLLYARNTDCLTYTSKLASIPEAKILAKQIESFDFATAEKSLKTLRML